MNAIDGLFNFFSDSLNKFAGLIPAIDIPFANYGKSWDYIYNIIKDANYLFPIDTIFTIIGIVFSFVGVMVIIWGISFVRDMLPF